MDNENIIKEIIKFLDKLLYYKTYGNIVVNNQKYDHYIDIDGFVHVRNRLTIEIDYDNIFLKRLDNDKDK